MSDYRGVPRRPENHEAVDANWERIFGPPKPLSVWDEKDPDHPRYKSPMTEATPMQACGHPLSDIVSSDEGTHYCGGCERNARA